MRIAQPSRVMNFPGSDRVKISNSEDNSSVSWMRNRFIQGIGGIDRVIDRDNDHMRPETRTPGGTPGEDI